MKYLVRSVKRISTLYCKNNHSIAPHALFQILCTAEQAVVTDRERKKDISVCVMFTLVEDIKGS
jgi:hypothetical protein